MRFVLVLFILLSISLSAQSQDTVRNLTIGEVFDFQEGDVFHFDYEKAYLDVSFSTDIHTEWIVLDRIDSPSKNKVSYRIAKGIAESYYTGSKEEGTYRKVFKYWRDTITKSYNHLDSSIKTFGYYFDVDQNDTIANNKVDTFFGKGFCNAPIIGIKKTREGLNAIRYTDQFAKGLGRISYDHENLQSCRQTKETLKLVYFKDEQKTCGEKLWRLTSANLDKKPIQQIFNLAPNPASDQMTIQLPNNGFQQKTIRIYNMKGRKMMEREVTQKNARLNLSPFSPGIYFVQIPINGVIQTKKLQVRP